MFMKRWLQGLIVIGMLTSSAACGVQEARINEAPSHSSKPKNEANSESIPQVLKIKLQQPQQTPITAPTHGKKISESAKIKSQPKPEAKAGSKPFPPQKRLDVKGIYVSTQAFQSRTLYRLIDLVQRTELNAMVIDVKSDKGYLTYQSDIPLVREVGANGKLSKEQMRSRMGSLKNKGIYTIARIVTFKDPRAAAGKSDFAMKQHNGIPWKDRRGISWVDPYNRDVWEYNIAIAEEALELGFDEIQFDYVRFPEDVYAMGRQVHFHNPEKLSKDDVISKYLRTAKQRIHRKGAIVSADVFGLTTSVDDGMQIGQRWTKISPTVDVISPMIYPSHYSQGMFGVAHPDLAPYAIIQRSIRDALKKNKSLQVKGLKPASIRPWLQDFTASWVEPHQRYGKTEVLEQIRAARELGIREYLLWNPSCRYSL
jgi:hypothetical protein